MVSNSTTSIQPNLLKQAAERHPLFFFFLIAYAFSWVLSIPFILSEWNILHGNFHALFVIKSFGPFLSALVMIRILEAKAGISRLKQGLRQWRSTWFWYAFVLIGIPALIILGIIVQPGATAHFKGLNSILLISYPAAFMAVFFVGGPLGEEPGWRGFALPRMQQKYGPLLGTLLLGILWTGWHLPDFLTSAQGGGPGAGWAGFLQNFPIFLLLVVAFGVLLTWTYNCNRGSIFMALLAHASINTPQVILVPLFPAVGTTSLNLAALIGFGVPSLLIILLTNGRLGYQSGQEPAIVPEYPAGGQFSAYEHDT